MLQICAILWNIWQHRNSSIWRNQTSTSSKIVSGAEIYLSEWTCAQERSSGPVLADRRDSVPLSWIRPTSGYLKCNVDASIFSHCNCSGYARVIHDHRGAFKVGYGGVLLGSPTPREVEGLALRQILSWLISSGYSRVVIEVDSQELFNVVLRISWASTKRERDE
ncbi:hypothetical protein GH714_018249 [Hevea brasiliensis]|uniref:RNase H type-1 domain-containing protein n=1 Tax=Hevea brasiliensis TaxID=3981 RepID=A0A6A6MND2_HEVBR|nr:hypothetical protein GH714_018249 [Hevea brasiliensis]